MSKELIVSVTPQETKAAILENDQVIEIHIERDKEHGVVGAICKGRVMKVLPGMQSALSTLVSSAMRFCTSPISSKTPMSTTSWSARPRNRSKSWASRPVPH